MEGSSKGYGCVVLLVSGTKRVHLWPVPQRRSLKKHRFKFSFDWTKVLEELVGGKMSSGVGAKRLGK